MTLAKWFQRASTAVRSVVDEHGGALVMTRQEIRAAIRKEDRGLENCPEVVYEHIGCDLRRRQGLQLCAYRELDGAIVLIYDPVRFGSADEARARCKADGLSGDVVIRLLEEMVSA